MINCWKQWWSVMCFWEHWWFAISCLGQWWLVVGKKWWSVISCLEDWWSWLVGNNDYHDHIYCIIFLNTFANLQRFFVTNLLFYCAWQCSFLSLPCLLTVIASLFLVSMKVAFKLRLSLHTTLMCVGISLQCKKKKKDQRPRWLVKSPIEIYLQKMKWIN